MRKFFWQRWALIVLLVTRLVIGELGHAMPVDATGSDEGASHRAMTHRAMAMTDAVACPEREAAGTQTPVEHHLTDVAHGDHSSSESDCCKSGDCECPCLHVPCATLDAAMRTAIGTTLLPTRGGLDGVLCLRPSRLFRPPAQLS